MYCRGLARLLRELRALESAGCLARRRRMPRRATEGRLIWPGVGEFQLTREQRAVVRYLLYALLETASPDVVEAQALRAAGLDAATLADVFAGSPAWGLLVVPGDEPGWYRLPEPVAG